jgi:hypothetical protein
MAEHCALRTRTPGQQKHKTNWGTHFATRGLQKSAMSATVNKRDDASLTTAHTSSPYLSSGTPTTCKAAGEKVAVAVGAFAGG